VGEAQLDLSQIFSLESHGPDTFVGESPDYAWGRIYGGLVIAQALWAATQSVRREHAVHSLHAYFILGGEPGEPVRYEVDRVRNGRSFTTRRVEARQSSGAILTLACSFQTAEQGPETQPARLPEGVRAPDALPRGSDAGVECRAAETSAAPPRSRMWARFPAAGLAPVGPTATQEDDLRLHACALAYLSDLNAVDAVVASHPERIPPSAWGERVMSASLDHAMWFHRPGRADGWVLLDMAGHGLRGSRGLATGQVFCAGGAHILTIAQEGLLRVRRGKQG